MSGTEIKEFIIKNRKELIDKIMAEQMRLMPELNEQYNSTMIEKARSDTSYNLNYLAQALSIGEKNIFVNYYKWLYSVLKERNIGVEILKQHLLAIKNILSSDLKKEDYKLLAEYLDAAEQGLSDPVNHYQSFIREDDYLHQEAENYLNHLINMEREKAVKLILDLVENGIAIEDIYLNIFQVVQYELGRLWQLNQISIAQEHYGTSVTQLAMSQLYPKILSSYNRGKKVLTSCIGDELHELGIRMVADLFELSGWDTIHLGSNTPLTEILQLILDKEIDLLAISVTLPSQLETAEELIKKVRENPDLKALKIMVGGRVFIQNHQLWQKIGSDAFARDAKEAVKVADSLL